MSFLDHIDAPPARRDRGLCPSCEATAGGCRGLHFLGGRFCCEACAGDHDAERSA